jgi:hypothetical protein
MIAELGTHKSCTCRCARDRARRLPNPRPDPHYTLFRTAQDTEQAFITLTSEEDGTQLVKTKVHGEATTYTLQQGESSRHGP